MMLSLLKIMVSFELDARKNIQKLGRWKLNAIFQSHDCADTISSSFFPGIRGKNMQENSRVRRIRCSLLHLSSFFVIQFLGKISGVMIPQSFFSSTVVNIAYLCEKEVFSRKVVAAQAMPPHLEASGFFFRGSFSKCSLPLTSDVVLKCTGIF